MSIVIFFDGVNGEHFTWHVGVNPGFRRPLSNVHVIDEEVNRYDSNSFADKMQMF